MKLFLSELTTPSTNETVKNLDPWGIGMTLIGMFVVYVSLVLIFLLFKGIAKGFKYYASRKVDKSVPAANEDEMSVELTAAIAAAINQYFSEVHDEESMVLTIKKVSLNYSPWSSKIYSLRNYPR